MSDKKQIPEVAFSRSFRGYDANEVNDYVQQVNAYEISVQHTVEKLESKVGDLEKEITRLRELESSLFRAMKMAEEAQDNWKTKMTQEAEEQKISAQKRADKIVEDAKKEAEKIKFLAETEKKQVLMSATQELKEQERGLKALKVAQREIAGQLTSIAKLTLGQLSSWESLSTEDAAVESKGITEKVSVKKSSTEGRTKILQGKGSSPKNNQSKPAVKKKATPKKKVSQADLGSGNVSDDGLPTLNKVLAAYAKSTGPKTKIGDIN